MDVDGTMTDGKIYMGANGEMIKAFNIKDGAGIHDILPRYNIIPIIITARSSKILENRCKELNIVECHQGCKQKYDKLKSILVYYSSVYKCEFSLCNVAYIGDDILDLECMMPIKAAGGIVGCPADAVKNLLSICDYIAPHKGGEGAVRDFIEYIISSYT